MIFFKKNDLIVLGFLVVVCIFLFFFLNNYFDKKYYITGVNVKVSGYKEFNFKKEGTYRISNNDKYLLTIKYKNNKVCITDSICKDKLCIHFGWAETPAKEIICLPNKISVKLEGKSDEKIDIISH